MKIHILCSLTFLQKSCLLWDDVENVVKQGRLQKTIQYTAKEINCYATQPWQEYRHTPNI